MKFLISILIFLSLSGIMAQNNLDENISKLMEQYTTPTNLKAEINVNIDIEGMHIPDKKIYVEFQKDKKPVVEGEGLTLLPKKGTVNQFNELLSTPLQAIYLSKIKNNLVYKLVSLDPGSDWITADIYFDEKDFKIQESTVNTRKFGSFHTLHFYKDLIYPSKSIITFDVKKFKIPLKFIGREQSVISKEERDKDVKGKITLLYNYL
ncbi:MAG: hypothetical protein ABFR05_03250 [Bacteroidota bacterium]